MPRTHQSPADGTILVTGGAGYVGSQTVRLLAALGSRVVVLDSLVTGHAAAIPGVPLVVGDIGDRQLVRAVLADEPVRAIVHFAALKSAPESLAQPGPYFATNVGATLGLLDEAAAAGVEAFVFSSSCAVYGDPPAAPVTEDTPTAPATPYAESKLLVERALGWFEAVGLRAAALRYFNAAGADRSGDHGEDAPHATNLWPRVVRAALGQGAPVVIHGTDWDTPDGTAIRDYIHVEDLAVAHVRALERLLGGGTSVTLNLGTGTGTSVREVIAAVEQAAGVRVPVEPAPRRDGDVGAIWAATARAGQALGWRATMGLPEIARSAVAWHRRHPDGYGS
jgi:UDP-glucose-4-epimerase GalE